MSCNSRRRQPTVAQVNLFHTSFTVRRYITVKEVRLNSSRGGWNSRCHALPQYGNHCVRHVEGTATVRWKTSSEMGARARRCWRPSPRGVWRGGTCARGQGVGRVGACVEAKGSGEPEPVPEPWRSRVVCYVSFFAIFISLTWVSLFMVPNTIKGRANG